MLILFLIPVVFLIASFFLRVAVSTIVMMAAAVIPGVILLRYIYEKDKLDKEPRNLLVKLFILGIISTICAIFTERVGMTVFGNILPTKSLLYMIIDNFIVVALSEEGFKYMVLKRATWKNPDFNCSFDAVVYSVFVSLGFAVWENIQYVFSYGFGTAVVRAVTAVPGHTCFGILMGACYGLAKKRECKGDLAGRDKAKRLAVILPVIAHGAYDFFATLGTGLGTTAFVVLILILYYLCFNLVKALSEADEYINCNDKYSGVYVDADGEPHSDDDPDFKY